MDTPALHRALRHLALPRANPGGITLVRVHQAVLSGDFSIAQLARTPNTTVVHVICLLSQNPVDWSPSRFRRTRHTATRPEQRRTWYEQDHLSLQDIANRERLDRPISGGPGLPLLPTARDRRGRRRFLSRADSGR
ncbi:hypothetical protein [Streptomyces cinereoruber]|uniref:hypothetical protein n=1 Tax=Streptomyces cinereoruber TaxID=67260 RepID=UPI003635F74A